MNKYQVNKLEFEKPEMDFSENSSEISNSNRYTAVYALGPLKKLRFNC